MDTLTHALSGALLARATEPAAPRADQLPRRWRMWAGFVAAAFPDSDFIVNFIDPLTYLTTHRGVTHSVILLPLWAIGLALLFSLITRRRYPWRAFVGICALGIAIHIAGDVVTAFGTMIFAPFSTWRLQLPTTFIIDLYFTGIIVAGLVAAAVWKKSRAPAVAGLVLLAGYIGFDTVLYQRAVAVGDSYIAANSLDAASAGAIPQPFSPFNWMVMVEQPQVYHRSYVSLIRNEIPPPPPPDAWWLSRVHASYWPVKVATWQQLPRFGHTDPDLVQAAWASDALRRYRRFAMYPAVYRVDHTPERRCVWFNDLRFSLVGRSMPFLYGACRAHGDAAWKLYRLRHDDNGRDLLEVIPD